MWVKYFSRGMSMQKALDYAEGERKNFFDFFGTKLDNHLYIKNKENIDIYYQDTEYTNLLKHLSKELEQDTFYEKFYYGVHLIEKNLKKVKKIVSINLKNNSKLLVDLILQIRELRSEYYPIMWYTVVFESRMEEIFLEKVKKYQDIDPEAFFTPDKPTFILQEEIDLLKVAENPSQESLSNHVRSNAYIAMYDYDYQPYERNFFLERLRTIRSPHETIKNIEENFKKKHQQYKEAIKRVDAEDRKFFEFFHFSMWFKDERSKYRNYESYICRPLYQEVANTLRISITELLNLTYEELVDAYQNKRVPKEIIESRKKIFALLTSPKGIKILTNEDAERFITKHVANDTCKEITGTCASPGTARGVAKIVLSSKTVAKVQAGDILISPMTRPDFVPAMKKSAAIVTDEGGMTCHAAIVARELKKPCIIGTKKRNKNAERR